MRYLESVLTLRLDADRCSGCAMCVSVCPHAVFALQNAKAVLADRGACMECGACAKNCPHGAIQVRSGVGCAQAILTGILRGAGPACGACEGTSS